MASLSRILAAAVAALAFCATQATAQEGKGPLPLQESRLGVQPADITMAGGDLVVVNVYGVPDLTQELRLSAKGELWLALVGPLPVAGMTSEQASVAIAAAYEKGGYLVNPVVSVFVKEYATQGVSVMGEVGKPGIYSFLGSRRLFDAIAAAGGLTEKAGREITVISRHDERRSRTILLPSTGDDASEVNLEIYPGDTILVSKAGVVYVVGEVGKPGGFVMGNNTRMTVLQALALAEGPAKNAALNSAKIVRKTPDGFQEMEIPLKRLLQAKENDIPLQADDVLFVPTSAGKSAGRRSLEAIVQMAVGVTIWSTAR